MAMGKMTDSIIEYKTDLQGIDWARLKETLYQDQFDNGRTPEQLRESFANSYAVCFALLDGRIIGKARALSDGVCNAYIVDVWTLSTYRHRGIASAMVKNLLDRLSGQHVYLFTVDAQDFYRKLGFEKQATGMGMVVGEWLQKQQLSTNFGQSTLFAASSID
jgi:predicted GNAT family acetyltransferase